MLCTKVCEDVLQSESEPDDLLVFALFGNGSNQIELRGNVCNVELLFVQKNQMKFKAYGVLPQSHGHSTPSLPSETPTLT